MTTKLGCEAGAESRRGMRRNRTAAVDDGKGRPQLGARCAVLVGQPRIGARFCSRGGRERRKAPGKGIGSWQRSGWHDVRYMNNCSYFEDKYEIRTP
ncbi:MAG: hypothetical protein ACREVL_15695 [Solimonas sp.]